MHPILLQLLEALPYISLVGAALMFTAPLQRGWRTLASFFGGVATFIYGSTALPAFFLLVNSWLPR